MRRYTIAVLVVPRYLRYRTYGRYRGTYGTVVPACTYVPALRAQAVPLVHEHRRTGSPRAGIESGE